jgi:hypothetical protein
MTIIKTYKYKLKPTKEQELILALEKGKEIGTQKNVDELSIDSKTDYEL